MKTILCALIVLGSLSSQIYAESSAPDKSVFVRDFYAAYKARDASRMAQFYNADATFVDPTFELNLKGPGQIHDLLSKALAKYETLDFDIAHTTSANDDLIVEGSMIGKLGTKTVHVPFVSVFHFANGKIAAQRDMFDVLHFLVQLGVVPPPFGPKPSVTPTPVPRSN